MGCFQQPDLSAGVTVELPAAKTCPNMTSDTSSGATLALFRTSLMTVEPRSWTGTVDKAPLKEPRTEGKARAMESAPRAAGDRRPGAFPLRRRPPHLVWAQRGAWVPCSSRTPGRRPPGRAGKPRTREKPIHPLPKSERMGAAHAFLTRGVHTPASPGPLKSIQH